MGSEKENNKKVGWECDNNSYGHGTVCKPICGPGAFPTGTNNVCICDKKNECKWKGYIKDHCQRTYLKLYKSIRNFQNMKDDRKLPLRAKTIFKRDSKQRQDTP